MNSMTIQVKIMFYLKFLLFVIELKELYEEVQNSLEFIKEKVGAASYFEIYSRIVEQVKNARIKRKQKKVFHTVLNPENSMKRKQQQNLRKKESKKRKVEQWKLKNK
jgi:U3 small nucleolar RNA-associated protein 20